MSKNKSKKKSSIPVVAPPYGSSEGKMGIRNTFVDCKNEGQREAVKAIDSFDLTILHGVPGTGKTYLAIAKGLKYLMEGKFERLYLTRPYVEAGENLGYLPGDYAAKIAPYLYPIMEIINEIIGKESAKEFIENGVIQIMPLAYMRGVTFKNSYIVADEMQNASIPQMRMLLTRIGENSKMVITGDIEQSDLRTREKNGLEDSISRLKSVLEISFVELTEESCVRSPLVSKIDKLYRTDKK
jgi:phosphate starvation-inducible PhoH-like protein